MWGWIRTIVVLVQKDLTVEARGRELVALLVGSSILIAALVGAGVSSAMLDYETTRKLYPMLVWIVFILSTTSASTRSQEIELDGRGYEGLMLVGVTGPQMYLSKVLVSALVFFFDWCVLVLLLAGALGQSIGGSWLALVAIGALSSFSLAALVAILTAISGTSRMRGALLPLVTIPLLFPLFFSGVELTTSALLFEVFDTSSVWASVHVLSFTIFMIVGINTYDMLIRE